MDLTKDVDRVWTTFLGVCNALRTAKAAKERGVAMAQAEAFMAVPANRTLVHKWRGWGLLLFGLLHIVKADVLAFMGVDSGVAKGKKRKIKGTSVAGSKGPKLSWWLNMRNEFASAHTVDGPILHLDPNGREVVTQLFEFALLVINHGDAEHVDPAEKRIFGDIERAAWQTIELILDFRVYCAVLEKKQLQEAMELALAAVDHGAVHHTSFPSFRSGDFTTLVSVIQLVLTHAPYDLHDWLPMLVPFLSEWFNKLNESATSSKTPQADIAPKMIGVVTDVGRKYFTFVGQLLVENGCSFMQYIKRTFKTARQRWKPTLAEFVSLYVELFEYHVESLVLQGNLNPARLIRDAKALLAIFLEGGMLQNIPALSHPSPVASSVGVSGSSDSTSVVIDHSANAFFACVADTIYYHDRLLHRIAEASTSTVDANTSDNAIVEEFRSPAKRSLESTSPMAWERLLNQIMSNGSHDESGAIIAPFSHFRENYKVQLQQQKQTRVLQRRQVARLVILSAIFRRHGDYYVEERIGDVVELMNYISYLLESKEADRRHTVALHLVAQLAVFSLSHPDLKSEMFEEVWLKVWTAVLKPDLPYANELSLHTPQGSIGEVLFMVMSYFISFGLVERSVIATSSSQLWGLYRNETSHVTSGSGSDSLPRSTASVAFLLLLLQVTQPSADTDLGIDIQTHPDGHGVLAVRSQVLLSVIKHIQSTMALEEQMPLDSSWEKKLTNLGGLPAIYSTILSSFLNIAPQPSLITAFLFGDLQLRVSQTLTGPSNSSPSSGVGPELDGFGVHFAMQEWGLAWMEETHEYFQSFSKSLHHPDSFPPLIELYRSAKPPGFIASNFSDYENRNVFTRVRIPDKLARRLSFETRVRTETDIDKVHRSIVRICASRSTAGQESVESARDLLATEFGAMIENFTAKLSSADPDSPKMLCQLNSFMLVGQIVACMYAQLLDTHSAESTSNTKGVVRLVSAFLQKILSVLADHVSAGTIDQARKSAMTASVMNRFLIGFHTFILLLQGRTSLQTLRHPCADALDLRIPSELRPAIRKIVASIEASLELLTMDSDTGGSSQQVSSQLSSDRAVGSRAFSSTTISSTPPTATSWDWDTLVSQPSAGATDPGPSLDDDDGDSEQIITAAKPSYRVSHATRILSLWSLRVILVLKKDSGLKTVKNYALQLSFTPDFLVAVGSMLCGIGGCDSLELLVKIIDNVREEVNRGSQRATRFGNSAGVLIFSTDVLLVLMRFAAMYENRKITHKEEIPELLLATARKVVDSGRQLPARAELSCVRDTETVAMEVFFRLNTEMFGEFVEDTMTTLLDPSISVRFTSARALQTVFYMYPDGGKQVFNDIYGILSRSLPCGIQSSDNIYRPQSVESGVVALTTLLVCTCSSPKVVPHALIVLMELARQDIGIYSRSDILQVWLNEVSVWYGYPSAARMVADHFGYLWSHHMMSMAGGQSVFNGEELRKHVAVESELDATKILDEFPAVFLSRSKERGAESVIEAFREYSDVILPLALLYDIAGSRAGDEDHNFPLVNEFSHVLLLNNPTDAQTEEEARQQQILSGYVQEQLITDLFALGFVLHSSSMSTQAPVIRDIGDRMLAVAEEKASTLSLSFSHLGHVVMKMVRFCVWDIVGCNYSSESEGAEGADHWASAMKNMNEKYSGIDWTRMNLAELLSEFHELLLRTSFHEPLVSRTIECICLFVTEIKSTLSSSDIGNGPLLQHMVLHVLFETVKNVRRRDKPSSRKLAYLVRDICDHFMKTTTDAFGKYLNFVVQEIADILARSSRSSDSLTLDNDDKAHFEWVMFAICNNLASGLGKYMADVEMVPAGVAACLDKMNSMLSTSNGRSARESASDRRKSLESVHRVSATVSDKTCQEAILQIEHFVLRANRVGERFYQPRTTSTRDSNTAHAGSDSCSTDFLGLYSQLSALRDHVRVVSDNLQRTVDDADSKQDKQEAAEAQIAVLAKLARTFFTLSTQFRSSTQSNSGNLLLIIADTLGEIGVWASDFELSPGQDGDELSRLYMRHFRRGALRETRSTFLVEMYEHLLQYFSSVLFETGGESFESCEVIRESLNSIKSVLRLEEGNKALAKSRDQELKAFLEPFVHTSASNWSVAIPSSASRRGLSTLLRLSNLRTLWRAYQTASFEEWICPLAEAMAEYSADRVLRACAPLIRHRVDMAVFVFPYVVWAILKNERQDPKTSAVVNESIRRITSSLALAPSDTRVLQLVIHTINFLRETEKAMFVESNGQHRPQQASHTPQKATPDKSPGGSSLVKSNPQALKGLAYSCLVDVDLLDLAEAAVRAKMPFSAMQYVEMWLEAVHGGSLSPLSLSMDTAAEKPESEARIRSILVNAYAQDDDVDGIYGVNDGRTLGSQMVTYNREGNYSQVLPLYDVALRFDQGHSNATIEGSLNALNRLGYERLLLERLQCLAGRGIDSHTIQEHRFELAWKSLQWESTELASSPELAPLGSDEPYMHQKTIFSALKALAHRDMTHLVQTTKLAKQHGLQNARASLFGLENTRESIEALLRLQALRVIEECAKLPASSLSRAFETWLKHHRTHSGIAFDTLEGLLSLEEVLAKTVELPDRARTLSKIYLTLSEFSRQAGRVAIAYKSHMKLEELYSGGHLSFIEEAQWKMERAKLLWSQRESRSAVWVAKQLQLELEAHQRKDPQNYDAMLRMLHVSSLTVTGKWIASQRSENSQIILRDYLQKAVNIVDSMDSNKLKSTPGYVQDAAKAHLALADYMAEMYQQVATRVASREWQAGKRVAEARQRELAECLAMNEAKQHENRAHIHALNKEVQYDYEERTKVETSVDHFLGGALRSFGKALALSAKSELAVVFRVLSLWFANQLKASVNPVMREIVDSVPSYKFVPLSYQIISRVGSTLPTGRSEGDGAPLFERVLSLIVIKLCEQHPHHALVQLLALKNSGDVEGKGSVEFRTNVGDAKSDGAKKYLDRLRKGPQCELVDSLDVLSNAYIQLALFDTRDYHKLGKKIPLADVKITTLGGNSVPFDHCLRERSRRSNVSANGRAAMPAVLTCAITPRPDMDYSGVSRVLSFDPMFSITDSGIHRPKIIYCFGSDGRRFKQLVKGKDDIRQDLVIEQVFDTMNQFLKDDQNTRKRNLRLRTYKVVPLSPIAGVLEWVDKTIPWGSYLVSRTSKRLSAHERYHPHEWKHAECRMYLKNQADKYAAYQVIQDNFTPVFHHFFLEKFPDAAMWYKRRLAYVQSAAVTSIVGYILGIGDRHSQNILIHEETAELVHIDFGVVFDQGMALFTPETVPFRLTRDLVDGMGIAGVEGVFTRCCEATLQLLRKKSASVVTILEVFVHDPLYRWTLSPLKALRIQEEGASRSRSNGSEFDDSSNNNGPSGVSEAANDAAARALIRVRQKLEGYEDPNGNALSIEGQVKQLISAAQDPRNLCALFPGWAPWL